MGGFEVWSGVASRRILIGSIGGVVLAAVVVIVVAELGRLYFFVPGSADFPFRPAGSGWLVALGAVLGVAYRVSRMYPALVGLAAGLLVLGYTVGNQIDALTFFVSLFHLVGFAPAPVFIIGVLLAATAIALRGGTGSTGGSLSGMRAGLAGVSGFVLALVSLGVLAALLGRYYTARFHLDWSEMRWSVLRLILFGVAFGLLVWASLRVRAFGVGALAGLGLLVLTSPLLLGGPHLLSLSDTFRLSFAAVSPVGVIMVGMLLVVVFPNRWASEQPPRLIRQVSSS